MQSSFEEDQGPIIRREKRVRRTLRWHVRGWCGQPRSLLVELNWRLGDEVMALPIFDALQARYPDATLAVLTNYPDLFQDHPLVRSVNPHKPSPDRYLLLRGAPRRVHRLSAYAHKAGVAPPTTRPQLHYTSWEVPHLARMPNGPGRCIALAPGASWPTKRWPTTRWETLAGELEQRGHHLMVLGQAGESLHHGEDFTGETSVRDAACLLHAADLAVCCDSGLMHLARAVNTPVIALFGPTDPDCLIRNDPDFHPIRSAQSCQGFWNHATIVGAPGVCPEGHASCLEGISVDTVLTAIEAALRNDAGG